MNSGRRPRLRLGLRLGRLSLSLSLVPLVPLQFAQLQSRRPGLVQRLKQCTWLRAKFAGQTMLQCKTHFQATRKGDPLAAAQIFKFSSSFGGPLCSGPKLQLQLAGCVGPRV